MPRAPPLISHRGLGIGVATIVREHIGSRTASYLGTLVIPTAPETNLEASCHVWNSYNWNHKDGVLSAPLCCRHRCILHRFTVTRSPKAVLLWSFWRFLALAARFAATMTNAGQMRVLKQELNLLAKKNTELAEDLHR